MSPSVASEFGKVVLLMGGTSAEREVSLMSGEVILHALRQAGVDVHPFDPAEQPLDQLLHSGFSRAFITLHGRGGEDGTMQGLLQSYRIPYTGSGVMSSALSMDKWRTKLVWQACGLPTPDSALLHADSDWAAIEQRLGLPLFVKPVHEGSSKGSTRVTEPGQLQQAWQLAAQYDTHVLAETFIEGDELTIPWINGRLLPTIRIRAPGGQYDYHNKYFGDNTRYDCPYLLSAAQAAQIDKIAQQSIEVLGCRGCGRLDLMLDNAGMPYLLEMNTLPGMTAHSLVPMAAQAAGISMEELCVMILRSARLD